MLDYVGMLRNNNENFLAFWGVSAFSAFIPHGKNGKTAKTGTM